MSEQYDLAGSAIGGMFWAEGGSGSLEFVVFERNAAATIVERRSVSVVADGTPRRIVSPSFTVNAATDQFRITVYLNASNTFHFDDIWLARSDP